VDAIFVFVSFYTISVKSVCFYLLSYYELVLTTLSFNILTEYRTQWGRALFERLIASQLVKFFFFFFFCLLHKLIIGSYPEPDESITHLHTIFL